MENNTDYKIEWRYNKNSIGNSEVYIIDGEEEILFPSFKDFGDADYKEYERIITKYSTLNTEIDYSNNNCVMIESIFYPLFPEKSVTVLDIISILGRREEPEEYDYISNRGYGDVSHYTRKQIIGRGCYIIHQNEEDLSQIQIKTYEDFLKNYPTFDMNKYYEFWKKYDDAEKLFKEQYPEWWK